MPVNKPYKEPRRQTPKPVGKARGVGQPMLGFSAAPAAGERRRGGGPRGAGKGMRNMAGQPWDLAVRKARSK